jgi:hypothetical protein
VGFAGTRHGLCRKSIDLDHGQLTVIASTEETDASAIREKEAKSGRARPLPSLAVEGLRRWRLAQAGSG